jgi:prepilin-type N-terminal cleavage/methylation domain-containing protein
MKNQLKSQSGFTLIELLVVIIILGILGTTLGSNFFKWKPISPTARKEQATKNLEIYLSDLGVLESVNQKSCTSGDSDQDGKVSCSYVQNKVTKNVQCYYAIGALADVGCTDYDKIQISNPKSLTH